MALGTSSWLNLDFAQEILRRSEGDNSIEVIDIFAKPATGKGDNYCSDMIRAFVEFSRKQGDRMVTEKKSLILKVAPEAEGPRKDLITKINVFETEMSMMTNTLKKMSDLLGHDRRLNGQVYHVQSENPTLLVIEDLAPLGYRMACRQAGLDLAHCMLAIQGLARFHASSVALCEKEPKQKTLYTKGIFCKENPGEVTNFYVQGALALAKEAESWPGIGKKYAEKLKTIAPNIYQMGVKAVEMHEDEFNVINHGDSWVNNMLFKYNDDNEPCGHIFVDFQMSIYTSPAIDLLYFLSTSASEKVDDSFRAPLLDKYLSTLTETMKELGCKTQPPTLEDIKRCMKERAILGLIVSITILPVLLLDKSEARDMEELLEDTESYMATAYRTESYKRMMMKRLAIYEKMGLLD